MSQRTFCLALLLLCVCCVASGYLGAKLLIQPRITVEWRCAAPPVSNGRVSL